MNYIKQINTFYSQLDIRPLSSSAISLWHALMHINNKAGWKETFTVAGTVLRLKSGLNESSFKRARNELKEKGCITYIPGRGNQAPSYQLTCLSSTMDCSADGFADDRTDHSRNHTTDHSLDHARDHNKAQNSANFAMHDKHDRSTDQMMAHTSDHFTDHDVDHTTDLTTAPLVKQKHKRKHKPNETTTTAEAISFYKENMTEWTPFVRDSIINWIDDVGDPLVLEAMKRALKRNKPSWKYIRGILQAWVNAGIQTVEAAQAEEMAFHHKQTSFRKNVASDEVIPDWFKKRKKNLSKQKTQVPTPEETAETERLLAQFRAKAK